MKGEKHFAHSSVDSITGNLGGSLIWEKKLLPAVFSVDSITGNLGGSLIWKKIFLPAVLSRTLSDDTINEAFYWAVKERWLLFVLLLANVQQVKSNNSHSRKVFL